MTTVIVDPAAAADAVCHQEQLTIWGHDMVVALGMANALKDPLTYDEGLDAHSAAEREIRDIIEQAFDHPELTALAPWQPIDTAPKDGTAVLVFCSDNIFISAWRTWHHEGLRSDVTTWWSQGAKHSYQPDQLLLQPTHWKPLPAPPAAQGG